LHVNTSVSYAHYQFLKSSLYNQNVSSSIAAANPNPNVIFTPITQMVYIGLLMVYCLDYPI